MIEYLVVEPVVGLTLAGFALVSVSVVVLGFCFILLMACLIDWESHSQDLKELLLIVALGVGAFVFGSNLKEDPPTFTKETCELVGDLHSRKEKTGKHTVSDVFYNLYVNKKTDETFYIRTGQGQVIHKQIICYRVTK